jgi:hypothetical protein
MMVVSTPTQVALAPTVASESYGSGWMRKRYQLSSCDSMPQPDSPAPPTSSVKAPTSVSVSSMPGLPMVVRMPGGVTGVMALLSSTGYQLRKPPPSGSVATESAAPEPNGPVRLMRCPLSSSYALTDVPAWLMTVRAGSQTGLLAPPPVPLAATPSRGPSDDVTTPMCMSCTG